MLKFRKMRHVRFFLNETLSPLSGVSLVRFLPTRARNEHNKYTDKSKFESKRSTLNYFSPSMDGTTTAGSFLFSAFTYLMGDEPKWFLKALLNAAAVA